MTDEDQDGQVDSATQRVLETNWREAMRAAREGMECIRRVSPELTEHISETGASHLARALGDLQSTVDHLHKAGRHVIGADAYEEYLETLTRRTLER